MIPILCERDFDDFRLKVKSLLDQNIAPEEVSWQSESQSSLFHSSPALLPQASSKQWVLPQTFVKAMPMALAYRNPSCFEVLYRLIWRITHENKQLLSIVIDPDVQKFRSMIKSIRRDLHHMHAFVRFQKTDSGHFLAWYEPDHLILKLAAPFFQRRFASMTWSILTPDECVHWDQTQLEFTPGASKPSAKQMSEDGTSSDPLETLWKTYYASTFNPARLKLKTFKQQLPIRFWKNLPESTLISNLTKGASARVDEFHEGTGMTAHQSLKSGNTLQELKEAAHNCQACPLFRDATQTVFGEGPSSAKIVLVGEQPGDQEDRAGRAFIGPAGKLLNQALEEIGANREEFYVTNAVKHFKWKAHPTRKMRLHQRPTSSEISACNHWLTSEIHLLKPEKLICLGAVAAQAVLGKVTKLEGVRGRFFETAHCNQTFVTTHPSALLRIPDPELKKIEYQRFISDLAFALKTG